MCVQTYPSRSKSSRPSCSSSSTSSSTSSSQCPSSPKQKAAKHLKTSHPLSPTSVIDSPKVSLNVGNSKTKRRKSVSFNEVVVVRPAYQMEEKSVAFDEVVMVRPVLHLSDYSDQEVANTWLQLSDKQRTKIDVLNTLKLAKEQASNDNKDSNSVCTRGLEKLSDGGRTRERRRISIREVLEEQESQRSVFNAKASSKSKEPFVYDTTKFRKAYKPHSRAARHVAHAVGKIDEMAAKDTTTTTTRKGKARRSSVDTMVQTTIG